MAQPMPIIYCEEDLIGTTLADQIVDTPCLLVDLDLVDSNIKLLFERLQGSRVAIRPHLKTVKAPFFADLMLKAGANGVCVAKIAEAEVMVAAGIKDILITTELIGKSKLQRLLHLLENPQNKIKVVVDSREGAEALNEMIAQKANSHIHRQLPVLVEVNVGQDRCGVAPGAATLELAQYIDSLPHLHLLGLQGYEGHLQHLAEDKRQELCRQAMQKLEETVALLKKSLNIEVVTTGGTGTALICAQSSVVTEVQPGSFIFMDTSYRDATNCAYANALTVLSTVISKPSCRRVIVDAGSKSLSTDMGHAQLKGPAHETVSYRPAGDEHGVLECNHKIAPNEPPADPGASLPFAIGDRLELIPSHIDTTVNLHDRYICHRQGKIVEVAAIAARGKVQ